MTLVSFLLQAILVSAAAMASGDTTDPCAIFCIRMTSYDQQSGYTIEKIHGSLETLWVSPDVEMGIEIVDHAEFVLGPTGSPAVLLFFTDSGERTFREFSAANLKERIAIYVGGDLLMAPLIRAPVEDEKVLISGVFTEEEGKHFVHRVNEESTGSP